jgi:hypothetical protein
METKLELIFNVEYNKTKLKRLTYQEQQQERWNKDLEKINEIYDKLSFLNKKGIKIEKVCCTEFNQNDANRGFYPYLRLPQFLATFDPIHDNKDFEFGGRANGDLDGKFNCETFILKLTKYLK